MRPIISFCPRLACAAAALFGCETATEPVRAQSSTVPAQQESTRGIVYAVPERTPAELERELAQACAEAKNGRQRVLLEFSAPWCKDCVQLNAMKQEPSLKHALSQYRQLTINVGEFDQHPTLLAAFGVRAIARWELLEPTDCASPPWHWRRLGGRTLEPETGKERVGTDDLAAWLTARSAT